ncbi:hypothetical protein Taro_051890, partial [Colocasia esculenta]|nr:hypothetical protein [Colocasia esculenta]
SLSHCYFTGSAANNTADIVDNPAATSGELPGRGWWGRVVPETWEDTEHKGRSAAAAVVVAVCEGQMAATFSCRVLISNPGTRRELRPFPPETLSPPPSPSLLHLPRRRPWKGEEKASGTGSCFLLRGEPGSSLDVSSENGNSACRHRAFPVSDDGAMAAPAPTHAVAAPSVAVSLLSKRSKKTVCLFFCEETRALAERVAAESDAIELRNVNWRTFEDGFPNLFISNAQGVRGQHVAFLASFSSPKVIFEQLSIIYALPRLFIASFTVVLPFFPTGTSERMEEEGDVATAFTLARILSNIPISRGGPTSLVIYDIHALQERFYFGDNVLPCFESGVPLLLNRLQQLPDSDNISIAFPDDGAWKRFHKQLQHFPTVISFVPKFGKEINDLSASKRETPVVVMLL